MSASVAQSKPSIRRAFAHPASATMLFFGFSSGLPFLLVSGTLALWLKDFGIDLASITMIASAGMTYVLKFLWAPVLDHWLPPVLARLGRRRGWLLAAQLGVAVGLAAMALLTPQQLPFFIAATLFVAFFGATQDVAVDAYLIEIAPLEVRGALVATYSLGYRLGLMLAGAIALILADHMPWRTIYFAMSAAMAIPIAANLAAPEPHAETAPAFSWSQTLYFATIGTVEDFFRRYGWPLAATILLFILLFKIPEQATIGGIMGPFYRDMGFSKTEIGAVTKIYGVWIGIVGTFVGGAAVARFSIWPPLLFAIVVCGSSNLLYLFLTAHQGSLLALTLVISAENFTLGLLGPPTVAFLSSLVNRQHTATQYSLLTSLLNVPGKVLGFFAGSIVVATDYRTFFVLTTLTIAPAALLCSWLWMQFARRSRANA
ncbi:MAG TPA: MFS transporter [Rudaea sp.]|nr:MFS transporter [Rudaea sp.]